MNTGRVTAAAQVILASQKRGRHLAATLAMALESARMLRLPDEVGLLSTRTRELVEMEADRNRWKERAAAGPEAYPGELAALRGTLSAIRTAVQHGGTPSVAELIAEHYADERAAYAAADPATEKDTPAGATSTPLTVYCARYEDEDQPSGWYTTAAAAQAHCEAMVSAEHPDGLALLYDWIDDEDEYGPVCELAVQIGDGPKELAGYLVAPIEVAAEYDPETGL